MWWGGLAVRKIDRWFLGYCERIPALWVLRILNAIPTEVVRERQGELGEQLISYILEVDTSAETIRTLRKETGRSLVALDPHLASFESLESIPNALFGILQENWPGMSDEARDYGVELVGGGKHETLLDRLEAFDLRAKAAAIRLLANCEPSSFFVEAIRWEVAQLCVQLGVSVSSSLRHLARRFKKESGEAQRKPPLKQLKQLMEYIEMDLDTKVRDAVRDGEHPKIAARRLDIRMEEKCEAILDCMKGEKTVAMLRDFVRRYPDPAVFIRPLLGLREDGTIPL